MEDIKVLENFIRVYKELNEKSTDFYFNKAEIPIEIIANLIKGYKELEEENEELKADNKYLDERVQFLEARRTDIINKFQNEITDTTIPKSLVREKIKELEEKNKEQQEYIKELESKDYQERLDD